MTFCPIETRRIWCRNVCETAPECEQLVPGDKLSPLLFSETVSFFGTLACGSTGTLGRGVVGILTCLAGLSAAAAPTGAPRAKGPPSGKIFRFRIPFEPTTLDWNLGDVPITVVQNVMRGLFRVDEQGQVVPDLVDSFDPQAGGKVWRFHLRSGVVWSDGAPLVAKHAADSLRRLLAPATASGYANFLYEIEGARAFNRDGKSALGISTPDNLTLEVRLEREIAFLPAILTHWVTYPVRLDRIEKHADHWLKPERIAVLGPYRISEWRPQTRVVLLPNPFAERKPWFSRAEGWIIHDDATALNLYNTGHLEFITDPGVESAKHPHLSIRASPIVYFLGIGPGHPLTDSRAGVLALSAAIQRSEIPTALGAPHRPTFDLCPPEIWSTLGAPPSSSSIDTIPLEGAPALARALLKEAGFPDPAKMPPLTLRYFNRPAIELLAEWLQGRWKKALGIDVRLLGEETQSYWSSLAREPAPLFISSKGASYPDPDAFFRPFETGGAQNLGRWTDADFDKLVRESMRQGGSDRLATLVAASRRLLVERPAAIPLYFRATGYLIQPFVEGLVINPLTSVDFSRARYAGVP